MHGAMNDRRLLADIFHNVNLAAQGPSHRADIVTQHPESRPQTLAVGDFDSSFKAPIGLPKRSLRFQPCRSVITRNTIGSRKGFVKRLDNQIAVLQSYILHATGVGLQLIVAPAFPSNIVGPLDAVPL